jgi:hypothetical protein
MVLQAVWQPYRSARSVVVVEVNGYTIEPGVDLSDADLSDTDLSRADLSGADLSGADLNHANLSAARLVGADLSGANLNHANLSAARLGGADLSGANLSDAKLFAADLDQTDFTGARIAGADFNEAFRETAIGLPLEAPTPRWRAVPNARWSRSQSAHDPARRSEEEDVVGRSNDELDLSASRRTFEFESALVQQEVKDFAEQKRIQRLCHFTHLSSFRQIVDDKAVLSRQVLVTKHRTATVNDQYRHDGHLDYISCSITFPNLWLLDSYRGRGHRTDEWIVLLLTRKLLHHPSTKFSPVNAAIASGAHVADGLEGLEGMFQPQPPSNYNIYRRPPHLKSCPTDSQAEVLVSKAVPADAVIGVVCKTSEVRQQVDQLLTRWDGPRPVTSVQELLFDSEYVKKMIWNGHDMDLDVREEDA